jgi:hypothetical protein
MQRDISLWKYKVRELCIVGLTHAGANKSREFFLFASCRASASARYGTPWRDIEADNSRVNLRLECKEGWGGREGGREGGRRKLCFYSG